MIFKLSRPFNSVISKIRANLPFIKFKARNLGHLGGFYWYYSVMGKFFLKINYFKFYSIVFKINYELYHVIIKNYKRYYRKFV